jgi:hypothetical protein
MHRRGLICGLGAAVVAGCTRAPDQLEERPLRQLKVYDIGAALGAPMTADVVVYGATPGGIMAAVTAARHGLKVLLVGGWRERHLGGMMSGGLGWTDYRFINAYGGHTRAFIETLSDETRHYAFRASAAERLFTTQVANAGISVVWSRGVVDVFKSGSRIRGFATADGRTFNGRVFIDASYEGDLLARAGVSYRTGREAADSANPLNGYSGMETRPKRNEGQFILGGRAMDLDPFRIEGAPESGLIDGVRPSPGLKVGAADSAIQAYNFRLNLTKDPRLRVDLPSTPPQGYQPDRYELLFRCLDAAQRSGLRYGQDWSFEKDLITPRPVGDGVYDVNNRGGVSTNYIGGNWTYPDADYATLEAIWRDHESWTRGFFYALAHDPDHRVPDAVRRDVLQWGLVRGEFTRPSEPDNAGWPYQLYVREARRLDNDHVCSAAALALPDNDPSAPGEVIAMASYRQDSHPVHRIAAADGRGGWKVWTEGGMEAPAGGQDGRSPLSWRIVLPRRQECSNLMVPFCVAATHQAFSVIRMELTSMALGEACGHAAVLACQETVQPDLQVLPYERLRERLKQNGVVLTEQSVLRRRANRLRKMAASVL